MQYWRMQLHPNDPKNAAKYTVESLAAGFIGLGFRNDPGDLLEADSSKVESSQKSYFKFARDMAIGDKVLIMLHNFPFALVTVDSEYNYIRSSTPELGIWFNHFRRIKENIIYYSDYETNPENWENIVMTEAIQPLNKPQTKSYQLIEDMISQG